MKKKAKILTYRSREALEAEINKYLDTYGGGNVIDIQYRFASGEKYDKYSAMIIYYAKE